MFVGRELELAALDAALARARDGQGAALLFSGEAGIGKTHLARAAVERAVRLGFRPSWGRAWEWGGAPTYWPWTQLLRELGAAPWPDLPAVHLEGDAGRFALFDATTQLLRRLS